MIESRPRRAAPPVPPMRHIEGTSRQEQTRLTLLNEIVNGASLRELGLRAGDRVLDAGAGLGQLARAMARRVGALGEIVAVEGNQEQLRVARKLAQGAGESLLVDFRLGDLHELPLYPGEWGSFDVVHSRFVLDHTADAPRVVRNMVRAVRTGGRVVLEDTEHSMLRLNPVPPAFEVLWEAYVSAYDIPAAGDPLPGRRLAGLLAAAGAAPIRVTTAALTVQAGDRDFPAVARSLFEMVSGSRERLLAENRIATGQFEAGLEAIRTWAARRDAALCWPFFVAEGLRE